MAPAARLGLSSLMRSCASSTCALANDNTIHFNGAALQVLPDGLRASYARVRVEVQVRLTAVSWSSIRAGAWLRRLREPVTLRAQKGPRYNGLLLADTPTPSDNGNHDTLTTTPLTPKKQRPEHYQTIT